MVLSRQFISSTIEKINELSFKLTITYSWYGIWNFEEVFVYRTLEECKAKLIQVRVGHKLTFIDENGKEKNLDLLDVLDKNVKK